MCQIRLAVCTTMPVGPKPDNPDTMYRHPCCLHTLCRAGLTMFQRDNTMSNVVGLTDQHDSWKRLFGQV